MTGTRTYRLEVRLLTPAFLGGASQAAEWRAPPLKALLRQMWRIAHARGVGYCHEALRKGEGGLFGEASTDRRVRSRMTIALESWSRGTIEKWQWRDRKVEHPEVEKKVGAHLYLGYGPLGLGGGTRLNERRTALAIEQAVRLTIRAPTHDAGDIERSLRLMHWFGTIGGRSRNGWGSFDLASHDVELPTLGDPGARALLESVSRPLEECLTLDWPHALGRDAKGLLIWRTKEPRAGWEDVMEELAKIKIAFRTKVPFSNGKGGATKRHVLAYPVTNHKVDGWGNEFRLPNQLRFKVMRSPGDPSKRCGLIYHVPVTPRKVESYYGMTAAVWQGVHATLDNTCTRL